ncbi:MAG: class I adenylate-forming enzyme family protein, partial [Bacteroidota bacterium]
MTGLHDFLRASAQRDPAQPVFIRRDQISTYGELDVASGRFAAGLRDAGIRKGDRVALVLDGDVDFLIAYYGIAKAGAAVIPLCPDTRTGPLVYGIAHAGAAAVILDAANAGYLVGQASQVPTLRLVIHRGVVAPSGDPFTFVPFQDLTRSNVELHGAGTSPSDLLSVTYTSGTTGRPKGVMLSHHNLMSNVRSIVQYLDLTAADRVAAILPFYYVYGNSVLHTHVFAGATIVHAGSMAFPAQVLKTIEARSCTGLSGVPATFARLVGLTNLAEHDVSSLRYFTQAGAGMAPALTEKLGAAFPRARF